VWKIRTSTFLSHSVSRGNDLFPKYPGLWLPTVKFMQKCTVYMELLYYEVLSSYDMAYVVT